jgi:hypothetical protein
MSNGMDRYLAAMERQLTRAAVLEDRIRDGKVTHIDPRTRVKAITGDEPQTNTRPWDRTDMPEWIRALPQEARKELVMRFIAAHAEPELVPSPNDESFYR